MFDGRLTLSAMGAVAGAQGGSTASTRRLNQDEVARSLFEPKAAVPAPPLQAAEQRAAAAATRSQRGTFDPHPRHICLIHDPATAAARLIALTGYGGDEDRRRSRKAGFDIHLTKPPEGGIRGIRRPRND